MDPLTLMALATIAQTGVGLYGQQQQMKAAKEAEQQGKINASINQSELTKKQYKKRREGTLLGGMPSDVASEQGTMLGSAPTKSLLG